METCVRGFSYKPETKVEDLKYVESEELERTWKTAQRERQKQQEQKIWEEFMNEQDIVQNVYRDPYQFLNQLPQEYIQELLEIELQKMSEENGDNIQDEGQTEVADSMAVELTTHGTAVCSEEADKEDTNIFNIFDDEDKEEDVSGEDKEYCDNESNVSPPCTVRERQDDMALACEVDNSDKISRKSSGDNVANMIEGSIYCAKVKDLRVKINEELLNIIGQLEQKDMLNIDPIEFPKLTRRSAEFCARFHRVHVYQLQRQIADIERHTSRAPALAQRTHYQAQLARAASLHISLLHALQVFSRSLPQTACVRESGEMLKLVLSLIWEATRVCSDARPNTLPAAAGLFDDCVQLTCETLEVTVSEYTMKMQDYMTRTEDTSMPCSRKSSKMKGRKRSTGVTYSKSGSKSLCTEAALSMYSGTQRAAGARSSSSKDNQSSSGTSKMRVPNVARSNQQASNKQELAKSPKKSPRSRRPLMRAPHAPARPRRAPLDERDVRTLVETVAPCASNHSRDPTPPKSNEASPHPGHKETPKVPRPKEPSRTPVELTPRSRPANIIARNKLAVVSHIKKPITPKKLIEKINTPREADRKNQHSGQENTTVREPIIKNVMENTIVQAKESDSQDPVKSPVKPKEDWKSVTGEPRKSENERNRAADAEPTSCEVTRLVRQLCGGDNKFGMKSERATGAKNAQLLCVTRGSAGQPSTPQLLRILEETIQKKTPRHLFPRQPLPAKDAEKLRMTVAVPELVSDALLDYRTNFVQHMLTSALYANSAVGKPWEKIASISEKIIDDLLLKCANQMELQKFVNQMYEDETC
ncbi:uncharacterized protein LOC112047714 isoform X2 [Bicyclus anynana]|uniref:Uncharacterized protein LOC112047714 isoform X2 n=1 Tax=Bicyclus anynana TaxID=110368 RepID=A0ABM3LQE8_BICAN|nr:uncharacterized protein LOC112047714 isoform X2 [Bicyclus anynana]